MRKRIIYVILLSLFFADVGYSFLQHKNQPLDGDMAWNLIPFKEVNHILNNPLGINAILKNQTYPNPNRFFCHKIYREYLIKAPQFLQRFVEPIESVYLSCGIAKILTQLLLIILLAIAITGSLNVFKLDFIIAALLITPFFQTNGYRNMGIIDPSTTYTFFYALPMAYLILYFTPFFRKHFHQKKLPKPFYIFTLWIPFAIVVCLSGPLNTGTALVIILLLGISILHKNYIEAQQLGDFKKAKFAIINIPKDYWFYLLPVVLLSIYSLYLGTYNSLTISNQIPLSEMYSRLPLGIFRQFTQKLGFPLLFIILGINWFIIKKWFYDDNGRKILRLFKWVGIFSIVYILVLPLGGYRPYRPNVLRYDTILPITLGLVLIYGISTTYIFKSLSRRKMNWYIPLIVSVLAIFTYADSPEFERDDCERSALMVISESNEKIIALEQDCNVIEWRKITDPNESRLNAKLLSIWGISQEDQHFYNK